MAQLNQIIQVLDQLLLPQQFNDYCPNGLQVQGKAEIKKIVTGVTACRSLLEQAVMQHADAILVHHGYFWRNEAAVITGMKRQRLKTLLEHDISLLAYHLPLDAHQRFGNNVQLAKKLGILIDGTISCGKQPDIIFKGHLPHAIKGVDFAEKLKQCLQRAPLHINSERPIKSIALCSGGAQGYIEHAITAEVDAYLTGEVSEATVHIARESDIHFFAAGHHATERYGVQALGNFLIDEFNIEHQFIDIDNPA